MIALGRLNCVLAPIAAHHHIDFLCPLSRLDCLNTKTNKCRAIITVVGGPVKNKRYYATEDDDLDAPLKAGWKRETTIREYTKSGIRGEVVYVAPCGKRFKQYPDIIRVS